LGSGGLSGASVAHHSLLPRRGGNRLAVARFAAGYRHSGGELIELMLVPDQCSIEKCVDK